MSELARFMGDLLSMGMRRELVIEKGYEYALAQQISNQRKGDAVSPMMMSLAASQLMSALPEAYRIHESRNRIW